MADEAPPVGQEPEAPLAVWESPLDGPVVRLAFVGLLLLALVWLALQYVDLTRPLGLAVGVLLALAITELPMWCQYTRSVRRLVVFAGHLEVTALDGGTRAVPLAHVKCAALSRDRVWLTFWFRRGWPWPRRVLLSVGQVGRLVYPPDAQLWDLFMLLARLGVRVRTPWWYF